MVSASSDKPAIEFDRMALKGELNRSVLLDINCQADDTPESRIADVYKTHLDHRNKRLKSNGCDAIYTASIIGQCLTELKHIYRGNKKLLICATKDLFIISHVYFFIDLCNLATSYYRVQRKFKLIKEIVHEDEDFWMIGYQQMLNYILSCLLKRVLMNFFSQLF